MKNQIKKPPKELKCPHCDKNFWGQKMQAEHNLVVHIMTQHKDLIKEAFRK